MAFPLSPTYTKVTNLLPILPFKKKSNYYSYKSLWVTAKDKLNKYKNQSRGKLFIGSLYKMWRIDICAHKYRSLYLNCNAKHGAMLSHLDTKKIQSKGKSQGSSIAQL